MLFSGLQRVLVAVAIIVTLFNLVIASDLIVKAAGATAALAKVHLYDRKTHCKPGHIPQFLNSYNIDRCYRIPYNMKKIQITAPAICANGTRAIFITFPSTFCTGWFPSSLEVSDDILGQCLHVAKWWSTFAFVCDGDGIIGRERRSLRDILRSLTPWKVIALIMGCFCLWGAFCAIWRVLDFRRTIGNIGLGIIVVVAWFYGEFEVVYLLVLGWVNGFDSHYLFSGVHLKEEGWEEKLN
jgi:hypothetical protein